jgi:GT2 family glycosyltransferase
VVPSLGTSPYLRDCLESAASSRGVRAEIVLVQPVSSATTPGSYPTVRQVVTPTEVGFSEACNRGLEQSYSEFVALLNDDAVVEPDWADQLIAALAAVPRAAAAQGVNLRMACPERMDGRGLAWNRSWQAIQIGHGDAPPDVRSPVEEVFGVSATAAVYRRAALLEAAVDSRIFDPRLESYYEDVDLACRLRTAGYSALSVPAARAFHVGGATTGRQPVHRASLIYGNRLCCQRCWAVICETW